MRERHSSLSISSIDADFDRLALLDDESWTANNHYHDYLLKLVPRNCENALEIGCGTGAFARELAMRCKRVVGVDMSKEMIRVARKRSVGVENLEFELADAMQWEFPRAEFDFVCSIATLHHTQQRELLTKMRDALKPNSRLVVLDLVQSTKNQPRSDTDKHGLRNQYGLRKNRSTTDRERIG